MKVIVWFIFDGAEFSNWDCVDFDGSFREKESAKNAKNGDESKDEAEEINENPFKPIDRFKFSSKVSF